MSVFPIPIPHNSRVLIAGAGGGFDFLCGLPIALELQAQGHDIHIANYSFTSLKSVKQGHWHSEHLLEVTADAYVQEGDYFPEGHLAKWYRQARHREVPVWCFAQTGVQPTLESYNYIIRKHDIGVVICIDGGIDGIFRGDEYDLGSPSMDSISVIAASLCHAPTRIYACTAFGTEGAEGDVSHAQALHRMADLTKQDAFLGVGAIRKNTECGADFMDATQSIFQHLSPVRRSIIVSTMTASMNGTFGKTIVHDKTQYNPPWISPLTSLFWYFEAEHVAKLKLFYEEAKESQTVMDVSDAIARVRNAYPIQPHERVPI